MPFCWWRRPEPKPAPAAKSPRQPTHQPTIPQPSPEELDASLQSYFDHLVHLLFGKLARNLNTYRRDNDRDNFLNCKIKKEIQKISGHPYFPYIENDMSEQIFHVTWGRLEAEVRRWGAGNHKKDRIGEQEFIREVFKEWKINIPGEKNGQAPTKKEVSNQQGQPTGKIRDTHAKEQASNRRSPPEGPAEKKYWRGRLIDGK